VIKISITGAGDIKMEAGWRVEAGFSSVLDALRGRARDLAPSNTGALRDSIGAYLTGELRGVLASVARYSSYLVEGTGIYGPHGQEIKILPVKSKALFWPGSRHPVKRVVIKGIEPMDFLTRAVEEADIQGAFDEGFGKG
jgi:hypothetical protein